MRLVAELELASPCLLTPSPSRSSASSYSVGNEWTDEQSMVFLLGTPSEPGAQSLGWMCTMPSSLGPGMLQCLPRVSSDHSVYVGVSSLCPGGWRNPGVVSQITRTWAEGGDTSAMPWRDRNGGRNTSPTGASTPSPPPWLWLHPHCLFPAWVSEVHTVGGSVIRAWL